MGLGVTRDAAIVAAAAQGPSFVQPPDAPTEKVSLYKKKN